MKFYTKLFLLILILSILSTVIGIYFALRKPRYVPIGTPPSLTSVQNKINNNHICVVNSTIAALLVVISHPGNLEARNAMRHAYSVEELDKLGMKRIFLLGTLVNDKEADDHYISIRQDEIFAENRRNSDIVQYDLTEGYSRLTYKSLLALKWGVENCQQAELIIKMDDDVLIDLYQVSGLINTFTLEDRDKLTGSSASDSGILFLLGLLYMTSPKTAGLLLKTSTTVPFHSHEDMYITGLLPRSANVGFNYIDRIYTQKRCLGCCTQIGTDVKYLCGYMIGQRKDHGIGGDHKLIGRIQEHSAYCYYSKNCVPFSSMKFLVGKYLMSDYITCIPEQCISVL